MPLRKNQLKKENKMERTYRLCAKGFQGNILIMSEWMSYHKAKNLMIEGFHFISSIRSIDELNWRYGEI